MSIKDVLFSRKEREIAHGCALTVITEPCLAAADGLIPACLEVMCPAIWRQKKKKTRYDLLSLPSLADAVEDSTVFDLLVGDLRTAISLHQAEYAAIICDDPLVRTLLAERLAQHPQLRGIQILHHWAKKSLAPAETLVVTCMDWRLHGPGGFMAMVRTALGEPTADLMTIPGVGKDLRSGSLRGQVVLDQLGRLVSEGLLRLILVAHTDCGKYGGHAAFAGELDEADRLSRDLRAAADLIERACGLTVGLAIAEISKDRASRLVRIPRRNPFTISVRIGSSDDDDDY